MGINRILSSQLLPKMYADRSANNWTKSIRHLHLFIRLGGDCFRSQLARAAQLCNPLSALVTLLSFLLLFSWALLVSRFPCFRVTIAHSNMKRGFISIMLLLALVEVRAGSPPLRSPPLGLLPSLLRLSFLGRHGRRNWCRQKSTGFSKHGETGPRPPLHRPRNNQNAPGTIVADPSSLSILLCNIRGPRTNSVELSASIRDMRKSPSIICLNETFLDKSIVHPTLEGYALVARRDRASRKGGGVAVFAKSDICESVCLLKVSDCAERVWLAVHSSSGPILLCCFYRPPQRGEISSIMSLETEYLELREEGINAIFVGDFNVHSEDWLTFSHGETPEGSALRAIVCKHGLRQIVDKPTRGEHLLDLGITDLPRVSQVVCAQISDHHCVLISIATQVPRTLSFERHLWRFDKVDWPSVHARLDSINWNYIDRLDADAGAN